MLFVKMYSVFLLLGLLLWGLVILGQIKNPTKGSQWVWEAYVKKEHYAQKIQTPKVVLVSGSNALFGLDSHMLSRALGYPVVNDAVNAGIGLPLILMHAKRIINPHDIVILPLEYPLYSYNGKAGEQMVDYLYARTPQMLTHLSLFEQFWVFWHVKVTRILGGYSAKKDRPIRGGLYGAHNITPQGDQQNHTKAQQTKAMQAQLSQHDTHPEVYGKGYDAHALGWDYLSHFVQWCKVREVNVVFMPSTLMYHRSYDDSVSERWFYENIAEEVRKRGWDYVGEPYDYMYDKTYYFNTNFHLTQEGKAKNTVQFIKDLKLSEFSNIFKR